MRYKAFIFSLFLLLGGSTCIQKIIAPGTPTGDSVSRAISIIEQGIRDIEGQSTQWRSVLERVANDLPDDISSIIRNDAQNLAQRSIAAAGVEASCRLDVLASRAIGSLKGLIAKLKGEVPPPLPPVFCQVVPANISLSDNPNTWQTITLYGYDFDQKDTSQSLMKVVLLSESGATVPLQENRIGRTSHYQVTLNLGGMARSIYQSKTVKLLFTWGGTNEGLPQIVVNPWQPKKTTARVSPSAFSYTPPRTKGDADFDTDDDDPMSIVARAELSVSATTVEGRIYLKAHEPRPDYTTSEGWSSWVRFYTAPNNWKITSVRPNANAYQSANITNHGQHDYPRPAGEVVSLFRVWGDRSGDEAGSYTRVEAHWRELLIELEEISPPW